MHSSESAVGIVIGLQRVVWVVRAAHRSQRVAIVDVILEPGRRVELVGLQHVIWIDVTAHASSPGDA